MKHQWIDVWWQRVNKRMIVRDIAADKQLQGII